MPQAAYDGTGTVRDASIAGARCTPKKRNPFRAHPIEQLGLGRGTYPVEDLLGRHRTPDFTRGREFARGHPPVVLRLVVAGRGSDLHPTSATRRRSSTTGVNYGQRYNVQRKSTPADRSDPRAAENADPYPARFGTATPARLRGCNWVALASPMTRNPAAKNNDHLVASAKPSDRASAVSGPAGPRRPSSP